MPDLDEMQVKVGIHESIVDRIKPGFVANIKIPDAEMSGKVTTVASVARPAGWWTGNVVKYDTIVSLPQREGLKPGMSAEVEVVMAEYKDVIRIPVSAVLPTQDKAYCWVSSDSGVERRELMLGDSNDVYIMVDDGIDVDERVVLNPIAAIREAQDLALKTASAQKEKGARDSTPNNESPKESDSK